MHLQSLRALCLAAGGPGSIWNYLEALVRSARVSGRFACGFQTDLHFANEGYKIDIFIEVFRRQNHGKFIIVINLKLKELLNVF